MTANKYVLWFSSMSLDLSLICLLCAWLMWWKISRKTFVTIGCFQKSMSFSYFINVKHVSSKHINTTLSKTKSYLIQNFPYITWLLTMAMRHVFRGAHPIGWKVSLLQLQGVQTVIGWRHQQHVLHWHNTTRETQYDTHVHKQADKHIVMRKMMNYSIKWLTKWMKRLNEHMNELL